MGKSVVLASFFKYSVGAFGSACIAVIIIPFLTRIMSPIEFGKGMMYVTFISLLFYLCNCGMDQVFVRRYFDLKTKEQRIGLLYNSFVIVSLFSLMTFGVLSVFYKPCLRFIFNETSLLLYFLIIIGVVLYTLNRFVLLSIRMQEKAWLNSFGQIITQASYLGALVYGYFVFHHVNFELIIYAEIFSLFLSFFLLLAYDYKLWNFFALKNTNWLKWVDIKKSFDYGWPFIFTFILTWAFESIDRVLILKWSNYYALGIYSAAFSLAAPLIMLQTVFTTMWTPIGIKNVIEHPLKAKKLFHETFHIMLFIMTLAALLIVSLKHVVIYLLGYSYHGALSVFIWIFFVPIFYLLSEICRVGGFLTNKSTFNIIIAALALFANIVACYIFIPRFGAQGAAIALAITYFLFFNMRVFFSFKYYQFRINWLKFYVAISLLLLSIIGSAFFANYAYLILFFVFIIFFGYFRQELHYCIKAATSYFWHLEKNSSRKSWRF